MKRSALTYYGRVPLAHLICVAFAALLFSNNLIAGNVNLSWEPSPSPDVDGYMVSYGSNTGNYTSSIDVGKVTTYTLSGLKDGTDYYIAVKAYDSKTSMESVYSNEVSYLPSGSTIPITSDFSASRTNGPANLVVDFMPNTTGTVESWNWNFDGSYTPSVSLTTPEVVSVTYPTPGTYSVSLTATGPSGSVTETKSNLITVTSSLLADFSANSTSGPASLVVDFTPFTSGTFSKWDWDFAGSSTPHVSTTSPEVVSVTYPTPGTYSVSLMAQGPDGSATETKTNFITVTEPVGTPPLGGASNAGLVAAYGFEESNGDIATDASGNGNDGIIKEAVRVSNGRYGNALHFDGQNDWVTIPHSDSLNLSTGLTLEAWVYPQSLTTGGKTVILKEADGDAVYNLYANENADLPISSFFDGQYHVISGPNQLPANEWTHLVATYDGQYQRLYVNGVEVAKQGQSGLINSSTGNLRIGGNVLWGEYFNGYIDEVRIYNRALSESEINGNLATPVSGASESEVVILGDTNEEPRVDNIRGGRALAFQTIAEISGDVTKIQVYLDMYTAATELVAAIYEDNQGHPGALISQGRLNTLELDNWNSVTIPAASVTQGQHYWLAVLGSDGRLAFLDQIGSGTGLMERSSSRNLTSLPNTWSGAKWSFKSNAAMSVYGTGN